MFIAPIHLYVTDVLVYNLHITIFSRVYTYVTRVLLVCTRMLLVCFSCVTRMYSYVTCMYSCVVLVTILIDWQTPFGGPWELMSSEWKSTLDPTQMPCVQVVCQRTQSTPQHNDRLHPWETLCLTHLFASAFNQILSFSVGLNISGSPIFFIGEWH